MIKKLLVALLMVSAAFGQIGTRGPSTTSYTRPMLRLATEAEMKAYLNLEAGTDFQAWDDDLDWLSANLNSYWKTQLALTTLADGGLIIGNATGALEAVAAGTTSQILVGGGALTAPVWGTDIPTAVTIGSAYVYRAGGTDIPVADGGTGASTLTDGGVLLGSGTGEVTAMAVLADGEMIVGDGTTDPVAESGATLRTSIGVGTGDSPQFTAVNFGHATQTTLSAPAAGRLQIEGVEVAKGTPTAGHIPVGNGTTWTNQRKAIFDVRDYGAIANDAGDDTAAFEAAMAATAALSPSATLGGIVFIPEGTYLVNINHNKQITWKGSGMGKTVLKTYTAGENIFDVNTPDVTWQLQGVWEDMTIQGTANDVNGVVMKNDGTVGRCSFNRVTFENLNMGVQKIGGNIGNTFSNCSFTGNNYHMYADGIPAQHAGSDYYNNKCHITGAKKAAFYYDSDSSSSQITIRDCIIEANPGFVFFIPNYHAGTAQSISVIDCTFESNSNYGTTDVTIGGTTYTAAGTGDGSIVFAQLTNCPGMTFTNCYVSEFNIKTDNLTYPTSVYLNHCSYDTSYLLTSDANSIFVPDELNISTTPPPTIGNPSKIDYSKASELLLTETFSEVVTFTTGGDQATTSSVDGTLFSVSQNHSQAAQYKTYGSVSITAGKWVFAQVTLKKISGLTCAVQVRNPAGTFSTTLASTLPTEWTTYSTITYEGDAETDVGLYVNAPASGTTVIRFGGLQILEFDTRQEAEEFRLSGAFAMDPTATNFYRVPGDVNIVGDLTVLGTSQFGSDANNVSVSATGAVTMNGASYIDELELGHATDTTVSRPAAGRLQVETVEVAIETPTAGVIMYGDGTTWQGLAAGSAGQHLIANGAAAPVWTTPVSTFKSYSIADAGNAGTFYIGGFYRAPSAAATLTIGGTVTQTYGTAGKAIGAHAFCVASGAGGADLVLTVTGISITDAGVRNDADSEIIVADCDTATTDAYYETSKKWLGQITYTLSGAAGSFAFNYGWAKYEDFGNRDFTITDFEITGKTGASETGLNVEVLHHESTAFVYSAAAFVPNITAVYSLATDYGTNNDVASENFAWKRAGLSEAITGSGLEGTIIRITTAVNNSIDYFNAHLGVSF